MRIKHHYLLNTFRHKSTKTRFFELFYTNDWWLCKWIGTHTNCSSVSSRNDWINILKLRSSHFFFLSLCLLLYSTHLSKHTTITNEVYTYIFFFLLLFVVVHRHKARTKARRKFPWDDAIEAKDLTKEEQKKKLHSLGSAACICRHYQHSLNIIDYLSWSVYIYTHTHIYTSER